MNNVVLIGRLTKDVEVKYITGENPVAVATITLAVDRPTKPGQEKKTDFPRVIIFGRQAENCEKFLAKGLKVAIQGSIQTGSYENKKGQKIYTTNIMAHRIEFIEWRDKKEKTSKTKEKEKVNTSEDIELPEEFQVIEDEDIPF